MKVSIVPFERVPAGQVYVCKLENDSGMSAEILSYGGYIRALRVPDKDGKIRDVVLGHDRMEGGYFTPYGFAAAFIGRYANRIRNAHFTTKDGAWDTEKNDGNNVCHSAGGGYNLRFYDMSARQQDDCVQAIISGVDHGEAGFPGNVEIKVTYSLYQDNRFEIHYNAVPEMDTVLNLTNHAYFNLAGHDSGNVLDQMLTIDCDFYTPNGSDCIPTGEILTVAGTPFDFRTPRRFGDAYEGERHEQIKLFNGYDHNLCLNGRGLRKVMNAYAPKSGITMDVLTDMPGAQICSVNGNPPPESFTAKEGAHYGMYQGFCFETQFFPDSPNLSHFPSPICKAGEKYDSRTVLKFGVR